MKIEDHVMLLAARVDQLGDYAARANVYMRDVRAGLSKSPRELQEAIVDKTGRVEKVLAYLETETSRALTDLRVARRMAQDWLQEQDEANEKAGDAITKLERKEGQL